MTYRNHERYADPTAGIAISHVTREEKRRPYMPLVYICSKYAGDVEHNVSAARSYCRYAIKAGCIPLAVHLLYPQILDDSDPKERKLGLFFGNILMDKCDEVWIFGSELSAGMQAEYRRARRKGYRIRYFTKDCKELWKESSPSLSSKETARRN